MLFLAGCTEEAIALKNDEAAWEMDPDAAPIPYGFWGLNGFIDADGLYDVQLRFGINTVSTATRHPNFAVTDLLPLVSDAGMHVNLRLVGDHEFYVDDEDNFVLDDWKSMLSVWADSGVEPFIEDGTFANHMLLDDIDQFDGHCPDAAELEEMARYSKEVLPGLRTLVRANATEMPLPESGTYEHVDATVNQYHTSYGVVEDYALDQMERAEELGLDLVMGMNMADGGDGSSNQPGWEEGEWAMSAEEIVAYGHVLSAVPGTLMFLNWEYDAEEVWSDGSVGADYFDQDALTEALAELGDRLAGDGA